MTRVRQLQTMLRSDLGEIMPATPIFVINLQRDVERRRHMTKLLEGLGLSAEFVTAVDGHTLSPAEREACDRARSLRT